MRRQCTLAWAGFASACVLSACALVGPQSIQGGREKYNNIIQRTSKQQIFANIIRVHNNEPTLFLDVTEVDAALTFTEQGTFGVANIFGPEKGNTLGTAGSLGSATTYSESPTIRYFPLAGQALVQQLASPITPQSLVSLFGADWPLSAILTLSADRLTPGYEDFGVAVNTIVALDDLGALDLLSAVSKDTEEFAGMGGKNMPTPDTLVLSVSDRSPNIDSAQFGRMGADPELATKKAVWHLWLRLLRIYPDQFAADLAPTAAVVAKTPKCGAPRARTSQAPKKQCAIVTPPQARQKKQNRAQVGAATQTDLSEQICKDAEALKTDQSSSRPVSNSKRLLDKRTMIGDLDTLDRMLSDTIKLKSAKLQTTPERALESVVRCVPRQIFLRVTSAVYKMSSTNFSKPTLRMRSALGALRGVVGSAYGPVVFVQSSEAGRFQTACAARDGNDPGEYYVDSQILNAEAQTFLRLNSQCLPNVTTTGYLSVENQDDMNFERLLFNARRFIIVYETAQAPPADAYVSYADSHGTYYIDEKDLISQKNFSLIALLLTMQAVASPAGSLVPTLSVGGSH